MKYLILILICTTIEFRTSAEEVLYNIVALEEPRNIYYAFTSGYSINDEGMVAGLVYRSNAYPSGRVTGLFTHSTLAGFEEIGEYKGYDTQPIQINNKGQCTILNWRCIYTNDNEFVVLKDAVRYTPGIGYERIGDLGGRITVAHGINNEGDMVGQAFTISNIGHAFYYNDTRGIVDLGTFGGLEAYAVDINDNGYICGYVSFEDDDLAFIYHEDFGLDLICPGTALRINAHNAILTNPDDWGPYLIDDESIYHILPNNWTRPDFGNDLNDYNRACP